MMFALFLLFTKHLIIDFPLQNSFQLSNKGTYGHLGGILHAGLHAIGTLIVFLLVGASPLGAILLGLIDGIVHYHIDWAKMYVNKLYELTPINPHFWTLLGVDQYLHAITYLVLVTL